MITTSRMTPFGVEVDGVDIEGGVDAETAKEVTDLLYQHHVLVIRGQEGLSIQSYARFGDDWGDPIMFYRPEQRHGDLQQLIRIWNSPSVPVNMRNAAMHWHSDSTYEPVPASVTMLYAVEAPTDGNDTLFAETLDAYDALSEEMKARIESLVVVHHARSTKVDEPWERRAGDKELEDSAPPLCEHPLVMRHPVTGRKALYGFAGTAYGIVGMDDSEAMPLLKELKAGATRPERLLAARAEQGTILMWDNYSVVHCGTETTYTDADGQRRLLYRISTTGVPRHARALTPVA